MSLGQKLKELRKEKGWSQDEFAHAAEIDGRQVSRYENDRVMPSIEVVIRMAKAYNVSIDFLLLEDVPRRPLLAVAHTTELAERIMGLDSLSEDDERSILHMLEAIQAKNRLKEIAAEVK